MKLELDRLNAKMDVLQAKAGEAKAEARQKYQSEMGRLRHQSQLARGASAVMPGPVNLRRGPSSPAAKP